jgi:hypothetical protein
MLVKTIELAGSNEYIFRRCRFSSSTAGGTAVHLHIKSQVRMLLVYMLLGLLSAQEPPLVGVDNQSAL